LIFRLKPEATQRLKPEATQRLKPEATTRLIHFLAIELQFFARCSAVRQASA
jgi:hypothetical protein